MKPIFISALKNVKREFLLKKLYDIYKSSTRSVTNKDANNVLRNIILKHQPVYNKKSRPVIKFLRQLKLFEICLHH